jgi:hypothetical protein
MTLPANESPASSANIRLPCSESCAAYRTLTINDWNEYGLCTNRQSPRGGYPVRLGTDCSYYITRPAPALTRAT